MLHPLAKPTTYTVACAMQHKRALTALRAILPIALEYLTEKKYSLFFFKQELLGSAQNTIYKDAW